MSRLQFLLIIGGFGFPFIANGAIYKCEIKGVLTFSDQPCSDNYEKVEINPQIITSRPSSTADDIFSSTDNYVQSRTLKREIGQIKRRIKTLQNNMDSEINDVKNMTVRTANNLHGASRSEAIAMEINVITERYQTQISDAQTNLSRLQKELNSLEYQTQSAVSENVHKQALNRIGKYVDNQALEREITHNKNQIKKLQNQLDNEITKLKRESSQGGNKDTGAVWQSSLTQEMAAISKQYQIKINALNQDNIRLRAQKTELAKSIKRKSQGFE